MKVIIECHNCGEEAFAEGDCPNDIIKDTGYFHDDINDDIWYCPKCYKEELK